MRYKKYIFCTLALSFLISISAKGQYFNERISADNDLAASIYHVYKYEKTNLTPAPKGYKPFYISHFGRHGSRFHTNLKYFQKGIDGLEAANKAGILTEDGKNLYREMTILYNDHKGMTGQLSPLGAKEHQNIASRMFGNFPDVFKNKKRTEIHSISSIVPRCIMSMANFTNSLAKANPKLNFSFYTGEKYMDIIAHEYVVPSMTKQLNHIEDSLRSIYCNHNQLFARIFTNPAKAERLIGDEQGFIKSIYKAGQICKDIDYLNTDIFAYFPTEELIEQTRVDNIRFHGIFGSSLEWRDSVAKAPKILLREIIYQADKALQEGSKVAADLKFGHDTGLVPLLVLLNIKEMDSSAKTVDVDYWITAEKVKMASNLQFVFYKNRKDDVLVKILYNEKETTIKDVPLFKYPYYHWNDLREYLISKTD